MPCSPRIETAIDAAATALWARRSRGNEGSAEILVSDLRASGLLTLSLLVQDGGAGLATDAAMVPALLQALRRVGAADLAAGRLLEGHVNAVKLVALFGSAEVRAGFAADVRGGTMSGVWNAEQPPGLTLSDSGLHGEKIWCSGADHLARPLVTAKDTAGETVMIVPRSREGVTHDVSGWRVHGMRATATGTVTFSNTPVASDEIVGAPGDYYRTPWFRGGAWRFCAVQLGAIERLAALTTAELRARGRGGDPHQQARLADLLLEAETARLWVDRAAALAEAPGAGEAAEAYVNLSRTAVERAGMAAIALTQRTLGLSAMLDDNPAESVARDLATYLRQPFPDAARTDAARFALQGGDWTETQR